MARQSVSIVCGALLIAAIACNAPDTGGSGIGITITPLLETSAPAASITPDTAATTPDTAATTPSAPAAPTTPAVPPEGAFIPGPAIDVSSLPTLPILPMGMAPAFCSGTPTTPSVTLDPVINSTMQLCLYHFPTVEGAYDINVKLVAPDGSEFTATYSVGATENGPIIVDSTGQNVGTVFTADMIGADAPPQIGILINTEANIPNGTWQVEASAPNAPGGAVTVPLSPVTVSRNGSLVSAVSATDINPLAMPDQLFATGDTIYLFGTDYPAQAILTLVLYYADPALPQTEFSTANYRPLTGTQVTADAQGKFAIQFIVGPNTPRGNYYVIAEQVIDSSYQLNPFVGSFEIE